MKRIKVISCAILLFLLLPGCNQSVDPSNEVATELSTTSEVKETTVSNIVSDETSASYSEIDDEEVPFESFFENPAETKEEAWNSRLEYNGNGLTEIPDITIGDNVIEVKNETYSDLSESLNTVVSETAKIVDSLSENAFWGYNLERCDNRLISISFRSCDSDFYSSGFTFLTTGERLTFDSLVIDKEAFAKAASPFVRTGMGTKSNVSKLIASLEDDAWYLNANSVVLIVNGDICYVPYREVADLIDPKYLPGDGAMLASYAHYDFEYSDGSVLSSDLSDINDYRNDLNSNVDVININGSTCDIELSDDHLIDVVYYRSSDGKHYLWTLAADNWDDSYSPQINVFDITFGEFKQIYHSESDDGFSYGFPWNHISSVSDFEKYINQ